VVRCIALATPTAIALVMPPLCWHLPGPWSKPAHHKPAVLACRGTPVTVKPQQNHAPKQRPPPPDGPQNEPPRASSGWPGFMWAFRVCVWPRSKNKPIPKPAFFVPAAIIIINVTLSPKFFSATNNNNNNTDVGRCP
jgi:hypothetical protein